MTGRKVAILGGGSVRAPLLVSALKRSEITPISEIVLYDVDPYPLEVIGGLCQLLDREREVRVRTSMSLADAVDGAEFVLSSIRVGGIEARARDERTAIAHGFAGQETTGPAGAAMALRTIPVALEQAKAIERDAPEAWLINFTNPAGMVTQAVATYTAVKVVGICDTPTELFHRIAWGLRLPFEEMEFRYAGLNHLGWISSVRFQGEEIIDRVLGDDALLRSLYGADLFDPKLVRRLGLIPTEYVFFYYSQRKALRNQSMAGTSRGTELAVLTSELLKDLCLLVRTDQAESAIARYRRYMNQRNGSYMQLEANAGSAFAENEHAWDPFEAITGYHRTAIELMDALSREKDSRIVLNIRNGLSLSDLHPDAFIETFCQVSRAGVTPIANGMLPAPIRGLVQTVKTYENLLIEAAREGSFESAALALMVNPIVGDWEESRSLLSDLVAGDPAGLGYLGQGEVKEQDGQLLR